VVPCSSLLTDPLYHLQYALAVRTPRGAGGTAGGDALLQLRRNTDRIMTLTDLRRGNHCRTHYFSV
jgi:hypothetical protein